jgi:hypothetical protein
MFKMLIVAIVFSIIPLICSLFLPDYYLGDKQNAVTEEDLAGQKLAETQEQRQ